jgi:hypothetical protein
MNMKKRLLLVIFGAICLTMNAQTAFVKNTQINDYNEVNTVVSSAQSLELEELMNKELLVRKKNEDLNPDKLLKKDAFPENAPANSALRYRRPTGYLITGFSPDFSSLIDVNYMIGNAFTSTKWVATGTAVTANTVQNINWLFQKLTIPTGSFEYKEKEPTVNLPAGVYETPLLTGTQNGTTLSFQLGDAKENVVQLGGRTMLNVGTVENPNLKLFCVGNYDLNYRITGIMDMTPEGLNSVGQSLNAGNFVGVANMFEQPASNFLIAKFYVRCGDLELYPGKPATLNVYKRETNGRLTLMATSTATEKDMMKFPVTNMGEMKNLYTVPFGFKQVDPSTGREEDIYLEIDYTHFVEFAGYKSAIMLAQEGEHPSGENTAYVVFEEVALPVPEMYENPVTKTPWKTSFLFDMDAVFPFLGTTGSTFYAPMGGGTKNFEISSYWLPEYWQFENEASLPNWITVGYPSIDQARGLVILPVTVAPSATLRSFDLKFSSLASNTMTLKIIQDPTGISEISKEEINVVRQGENFLLTYPASATAVSVYNITGQQIAEYALNASGSSTIPASDLSKGIYILKFAGINVSVKVVK